MMRIKIKGATPANIAQTIKDILEQCEVDMCDANLYINFTKKGVPVVYVNDEYEEVNLIRTLDPDSDPQKMNINFGQFITRAKIKAYQEEKERKRLDAFRQAQIQRSIGYLYLGKKDNNYKLFITTQNPIASDFKYTIKQKEKNGYEIPLIMKRQYVHQFFDHLKAKFKSEGKEITTGSYPFFNLNLEDIEYIKSEADEIIKEVI